MSRIQIDKLHPLNVLRHLCTASLQHSHIRVPKRALRLSEIAGRAPNEFWLLHYPKPFSARCSGADRAEFRWTQPLRQVGISPWSKLATASESAQQFEPGYLSTL
jgi:hypothetical protein